MIAFATALLFFGFVQDSVHEGIDRSAPAKDTLEARIDDATEFIVRGSEDQALLYLPRNEKLVYSVSVDFAIFSTAAGMITQTCSVAPQQDSLLKPSSASAEPALDAVYIELHATGDSAIYTLDSKLMTHHLQQSWPRLIYRTEAAGSSKRRRESMIGVREGVQSASYRRDTKNGAPKGTRIWKEPVYREVPKDTLDMLSAIFACRTLIREGRDELSFPMLDKTRLWKLTLRKGAASRIKTGAGSFDVFEVLLKPAAWPDEEVDKKRKAKFEGLFGMEGTVHLWVDRKTGVTVRIQGDVPVAFTTIGVDIVLESFEGTPSGFSPIAN